MIILPSYESTLHPMKLLVKKEEVITLQQILFVLNKMEHSFLSNLSVLHN